MGADRSAVPPHSLMLIQIVERDRMLLAGIAGAMEEAARRSGGWLACRPGCTACCMGPFAITPLDAIRLHDGLARIDAPRAQRVRARAASYVAAIAAQYPGDPCTGELVDEDSLPESMDAVWCPALDPDSGLCDLYEWRPVTCRTFGPVTRLENGVLAACELCYAGATNSEMESCAVETDAEGIERELLAQLSAAGLRGLTIVAFALANSQKFTNHQLCDGIADK